MRIRRGYYQVCWLPETDAQEIDRLMRAGRLPKGTLRKFGLLKSQTYYHRKHLGRIVRLVYYKPGEWERRKLQVQRLRRHR